MILELGIKCSRILEGEIGENGLIVALAGFLEKRYTDLRLIPRKDDTGSTLFRRDKHHAARAERHGNFKMDSRFDDSTEKSLCFVLFCRVES